MAESWELTDPNTITYQVRQGVHFHDKAPANGRELTADDVAFSLNRQWESRTSIFPGNPYIQSITAPDKSTVVIKSDPGKMGVIYRYASWYAHTYPREAIEKYGDMGDWRNACGSGAFLLTDYVAGSSATFERNPNFWDKDPIHPENQIPYLDGVKYLVIPDVSTRLAALRTGKIDFFPGVEWEEAASLMKTNPELEYKNYPGGPPALMWRVDKPELPFNDIRVRQALQLAVNNEEIARDFYGGFADVLGWPAAKIPEFKDCYISLEELPESTRQLYEYHPDKAKQLLAEAGYPDGFKTTIVCYKDQVDILSIVKAYWADVGVDLKLDVREYGAYQSARHGKTYEEIFMGGISTAVPDQYPFARVGNINNESMVNDPRIEEAYATILVNYFNWDKVLQILKETNPYYIGQSYHLVLPAPYMFTFWQPWVKNYHGEIYVGTWSMMYNFVKWTWIDQDLKEKMTGTR